MTKPLSLFAFSYSQFCYADSLPEAKGLGIFQLFSLCIPGYN